ncbi:hypothetical protein PMG71_05950 [Roseofilum sp. BLCC_M154]|uniref:Uncharacterized protein n=1 Tax=Roseofilum acuticapitatum BLCC-M154 TaxID=3022444 RepID=A0ABT7APY5_9CYAN|nr:hypothetical protein [Roseofilum acuticapitatum]MDJ1168963.1 hypothetical protein [Roseofilum acuticapitatum BLCC-M154]
MINLLHTIRKTKKILFALVSLLTLTLILITSLPSHGLIPDFAYIVKFQGSRLTLGAGNSRNRQPVQLQDRLESNRILYVPGDNQHWANLAFITNSPIDSTGLMVTAGPHRSATQWSFPCTARGHFTIGWQRGGDRGCEPGIRVQSSGSATSQLLTRKALTAQSTNEVVVVPTPGESLLQTSDSSTGVVVDVLIGDVQVQSDRYPQGRLIRAGQRYAYPEDTVTPIDSNAILNSPELRNFRNPNNWTSPDLPDRAASSIVSQLTELETALRQLPQQTASQSTPTQASNQPQTTTQSALGNQWALMYDVFVSSQLTNDCHQAGGLAALTLINSSLTGYTGSLSIPNKTWTLNEPSIHSDQINGSINGDQVQLRFTDTMDYPYYSIDYILNGSINNQGFFEGTGRVSGGGCEGRTFYFRLMKKEQVVEYLQRS